MGLRIRHAGIYVSNIELMIEFYMNLFETRIEYRKIEEGVATNKMFSETGVRIDVCKLKFPDGCIIELINSLDKTVDSKSEKSGSDIRKPGQVHIAFTVSDAEEAYKNIILNNGKCFSEPIESLDGKVKVFFAQDPEGNYLEIVEEKS